MVLFAALLWLPLIAQGQGAVNRAALPQLLSFEAGQLAGEPRGWGGGPSGTIFADDKVVHGGKWAVRIDRNARSPQNFSAATLSIPIDFPGTRIELRGFLKLENVSEYAGLWMREDGDNGVAAFDNMQSRELKGTHPWMEYSITLPLRAEARQLFFGVLMGGTGKTWADDLRLLVDGKAVWEVPGKTAVRL